MGAGEQVDRYVRASQGHVPEGRARVVPPGGPTETEVRRGCGDALGRGCLHACAHLAGEEPARSGASLLGHAACPGASLSIFPPSSKSQPGPTSQTCKLRPESLQRYLGAQ